MSLQLFTCGHGHQLDICLDCDADHAKELGLERARVRELEGAAGALLDAIHISLGGVNSMRGTWFKGGGIDCVELCLNLSCALSQPKKEGET